MKHSHTGLTAQTDTSSGGLKQIIIATSIALSLSVISADQQNLVPSMNYELPVDKRESWDHGYGFTETREEFAIDGFDKTEIMSSFATKLLLESEELKPEIVSVMNKNFWDLF